MNKQLQNPAADSKQHLGMVLRLIMAPILTTRLAVCSTSVHMWASSASFVLFRTSLSESVSVPAWHWYPCRHGIGIHAGIGGQKLGPRIPFIQPDGSSSQAIMFDANGLPRLWLNGCGPNAVEWIATFQNNPMDKNYTVALHKVCSVNGPPTTISCGTEGFFSQMYDVVDEVRAYLHGCNCNQGNPVRLHSFRLCYRT